MGQQVQPQVGVGGVGGRDVEVDLDHPDLGADAAPLVGPGERVEALGRGGLLGAPPERGRREPRVEDLAPSVIVASP